jgi:hypothetical protein
MTDDDSDFNMPAEDSSFDLEGDVMGDADIESSEEDAGNDFGGEQILPTPDELGIDMTVNN